MQTGLTKETRQLPKLNSRLSFRPVIENWKKKIAEGGDGLAEFYGDLLARVQAVPELMGPIDDLSLLNKHKKLVDIMIASILPLTLSDEKDYYAIAVPFSYKTIFSSKLFRNLFLGNENDIIKVKEDTAKSLSQEKVCSAYQLIFSKYYNKKLVGNTTSVYPYSVPGSTLTKYLQL